MGTLGMLGALTRLGMLLRSLSNKETDKQMEIKDVFQINAAHHDI